MSKFTLFWEEKGRQYSQIINLSDPNNKQSGVIRIGRDPNLCDIVLECPRVSRLHAEIFSNQANKEFQIQNLRGTNPIFVNGRKLIHGCLDLPDSSTFVLGNVEIKAIEFAETTRVKTPADRNSITLSQFLPIASSEELHSKGYLLPGIITVVWVVLLFSTVGKDRIFNFLLALFLGGLGFLFIYQLCGKKKQAWILTLPIILTPLLLLSPIWKVISILFREILPGQIPASNASFFVVFIGFFFGAGLAEELLKALPLFILNGLSKIAFYPKLAIKEPLDGILLGAASGLGFTLLETLGQYVPDLIQQASTQFGEAQGQLVGLQLLIPRIVGSVFGHMAYTGYFGYYIGLAFLKPQKMWQLLLIGYLIASLIHALWNTSAILGGWALALSGILAYCLLTGAILKARQLSPDRRDNFATKYFGNK